MHSVGTTVYLVSCVSKKRESACEARNLYVSDLFVKARRYVEASGCPWFVLSAQHGLVAPDQVIAPYERTLNTMKVSDRREWAERVAGQLAEAMPDLSRVVFLAGERYREFLARQLAEHKVAVSVPMQGLRIGEQLAWLRRHSPPPCIAAAKQPDAADGAARGRDSASVPEASAGGRSRPCHMAP